MFLKLEKKVNTMLNLLLRPRFDPPPQFEPPRPRFTSPSVVVEPPSSEVEMSTSTWDDIARLLSEDPPLPPPLTAPVCHQPWNVPVAHVICESTTLKPPPPPPPPPIWTRRQWWLLWGLLRTATITGIPTITTSDRDSRLHQLHGKIQQAKHLMGLSPQIVFCQIPGRDSNNLRNLSVCLT